MIPPILMIALIAMGLGASLAKHGEPRTMPHSFWVDAIASAITLAILHWGGFFDPLLGW
jgi:hypothetical protein